MDVSVEDKVISEDGLYLNKVTPEEYKGDMHELHALTRELDVSRIRSTDPQFSGLTPTVAFVTETNEALNEDDEKKLRYPTALRLTFGKDGEQKSLALSPSIVSEEAYETYTEILGRIISIGARNLGVDRLLILLSNVEVKRRSAHLKAAAQIEHYLNQNNVAVNSTGELDKQTLRKLFEILYLVRSFHFTEQENPVSEKSEAVLPELAA